MAVVVLQLGIMRVTNSRNVVKHMIVILVSGGLSRGKSHPQA